MRHDGTVNDTMTHRDWCWLIMPLKTITLLLLSVSCFQSGAAITLSRLKFFQSVGEMMIMSSSTPSTVISSSMDSEENEEIIKSCENGAIAPEQAIPGAYQTICTRLPSREILLKTKEDASTIINIAQESTGPGQTGMTIWNSGLILVRLFEAIALSDPQWFRSKTLVELGCGTGLASIAAAKIGAKSIFATDGNPNVIKLATDNIVRNDVAQIVQPSILSCKLLYC